MSCNIFPHWERHLSNIATGVGKVVSSYFTCADASPPITRGASARAATPSLSAEVLKTLATPDQEAARRRHNIQFKAVPSTRLGRAAEFGSLFAKIGWERMTTSTPSAGGQPNDKLSSASRERVVETLCRMRGAVLKLGQMLSIQDENTVPSHVTAVFNRVRDSAFAMPLSQLRRTLQKEFKDPKWRESIVVELDEVPVAAASIGQVHRARLSPSKSLPRETGEEAVKGEEVAIKVQYPGVATSIDSDIGNLRSLFRLGVIPPGMFVEQILHELRTELKEECQYLVEAEKQERYRHLLLQHPVLSRFFHVPRVYRELCTQQMLVTEYVRGVPIDKVAANPEIPTAYRSYVGEQLMRLTLTELFEWKFMQTDPNFSNFLFDAAENRVHLLDFGAARVYPEVFVKDYFDVVAAAARQDRNMVVEKSIALGFLTGREVKEMMDAHVDSVILLGKPFRDREQDYDFASENIPAQVQKLVPTMVRLRLKAPPIPAYSLHRRLSGTILLCTRLKAKVPSGKVFWEMYEAHQQRSDMANAEGKE